MKLQSKTLKILSTFLASVFFLNNCLIAGIPQAKVWEDRKEALEKRQNAPQYASLTNPLPQIQSAIRTERSLSLNPQIQVSKALPASVRSIYSAYGDVRKIALKSENSGTPLVVLVQDIHDVEAAQRNIAHMLGQMQVSEKKPLVVGVEGAAGAFRLKDFRNYTNVARHEAISNYLLANAHINGSEFFGLMSSQEPTLWGVEDADLYRANIAAYRAGVPNKLAIEDFITAARTSLEPVKKKVYSTALLKYESRLDNYHEGLISLSSFLNYVIAEAPVSLASYPNVVRFQKAMALEKSLDFAVAEKEKNAILTKLSETLSKSELEALLAASVAYRSGEKSLEQFFGFLTLLAETNKISLAKYSSFEKYLSYMGLSQNINTQKLIDETENLKTEVANALATTPEQKELMQVGRDLWLLDLLVNNQFGPSEWNRYEADKARITALSSRISKFAKFKFEKDLAQLVTPFATFYGVAMKRNDALLRNFLAKARDSKNTAAVLVTGGFHTAGLETLLDKKGLSYVTLAPKLDKIDESHNYLDVFGSKRTSVEKLVLGEKLFLAKPAALAQGGALAADMTAVRVDLTENLMVIADGLLAAITGEKGLAALQAHWAKTIGADVSLSKVRVSNGQVSALATVNSGANQGARFNVILSAKDSSPSNYVPMGNLELNGVTFYLYGSNTRWSPITWLEEASHKVAGALAGVKSTIVREPGKLPQTKILTKNPSRVQLAVFYAGGLIPTLLTGAIVAYLASPYLSTLQLTVLSVVSFGVWTWATGRDPRSDTAVLLGLLTGSPTNAYRIAYRRPFVKTIPVDVRANILEATPEIFGDQTVNGRKFNVQGMIGRMTEQFGPMFDKVLKARQVFSALVASGKAKYGWAKGDKIFADADGNVMTADQIRQGMIDNAFKKESKVSWKLNANVPVPETLLRSGLEGTGPADDLGMAMGALNAGSASWMFDWEDAGNDYKDRLYRGWSNLRGIVRGEWTGKPYIHPTKIQKSGPNAGKPSEYSFTLEREKWASIFHRIPGLHLRNRQITYKGQRAPASIVALVIHTLNNFDALKNLNGQGTVFYVPKIETPEEAQLVAVMLKAIEEEIGVKRGTIKIKMLHERAQYTAHQEIIMWVLRENLIGPNVGRWDYINSLMEMNKDNGQTYMDPDLFTMTSSQLTSYTRRNALLTLLVDGFPIGGMSALMQNSQASKEDNDKALNDIWFDKLRERLTGLIVINGVERDAYRQSWVATTDKRYVDAGKEGLVTDRADLQNVVNKANATQMATLRKLGLINEQNQITPYVLKNDDLTIENLWSEKAWKDITDVAEGDVTERGLRYAMYMASEYMFQQLNGNNAAAIPLREGDDKAIRLMNDFATYEIFWHWLWTALHNGATLTKDGASTKAGEKIDQDLIKRLLAERTVKVREYFATHPPVAGTPSAEWDRDLAWVTMELLERQLLSNKWIPYGSRVLLSIIEKSAEERAQILDAIFAESRDAVVNNVSKGTWSYDALEAYDYVYDSGPVNTSGIREGLGKITDKVFTEPLKATVDTVRKLMMTGIPNLARRLASTLLYEPTTRQRARVKKNNIWTEDELKDAGGDIKMESLQNILAQKLFDVMEEAQRTKVPATVGGVMDGPTAAAAAEAGFKAFYFSGWQAAHHWGNPDLAQYPFDTIPKHVEAIYKYLYNRYENQMVQFKQRIHQIDAVFDELYKFTRSSAKEDLAAQKDVFVKKFIAATVQDRTSNPPKTKTEIFFNATRENEDLIFGTLFSHLVDEAFALKGNTSQEKRDALRLAARKALQAQLVDYLLPMYTDADTGHQSMTEMVRLYIKAGSASMHIEDQAHGLKKCGHMAGKVLVSTAEHLRRLVNANAEIERQGSLMMIIARTDAEAAKLLVSAEDGRDHYFIRGTTKKDLIGLADLIRLARREIDIHSQRGDVQADVDALKEIDPELETSELKNLLKGKTPEELVDELGVKYPTLAAAIREVWRLRGEVKGKRLEPNSLLKYRNAEDYAVSVEELWKHRETLEHNETNGFEIPTNASTVFITEEGEEITLQQVWDRKPAHIQAEMDATSAMTAEWGNLADLKTYTQAVSHHIMTSNSPSYAWMDENRRKKVKAKWEKLTDPLKYTLDINQLKALAKSRPFMVDIDWSWEPARTYEGYYQIDSNQGVTNAVRRMRVYSRQAHTLWMEQDGPNIHHSKELVEGVNADKQSEGVYYAMNLSPSFNWWLPKNWKTSLSKEQIKLIEEASDRKKNPDFDWESPDTWGNEEQSFAVLAMMNAMANFSSDMGKLGYGFQFVTIFQDHATSLGMARAAKRLAEDGAFGYAIAVQNWEERLKARFHEHQYPAGVPRVTIRSDIYSRGSSAGTKPGGADGTHGQFGGSHAFETVEDALALLFKFLSAPGVLPYFNLATMQALMEQAVARIDALPESFLETMAAVKNSLPKATPSGVHADVFAAAEVLTRALSNANSTLNQIGDPILNLIHIISRELRKDIATSQYRRIQRAVDLVKKSKDVMKSGIEVRVGSYDHKDKVVHLELTAGQRVLDVHLSLAQDGLLGKLTRLGHSEVNATWKANQDGHYEVTVQPHVTSVADWAQVLAEELYEIRAVANGTSSIAEAHDYYRPLAQKLTPLQLFQSKDVEDRRVWGAHVLKATSDLKASANFVVPGKYAQARQLAIEAAYHGVSLLSLLAVVEVGRDTAAVSGDADELQRILGNVQYMEDEFTQGLAKSAHLQDLLQIARALDEERSNQELRKIQVPITGNMIYSLRETVRESTFGSGFNGAVVEELLALNASLYATPKTKELRALLKDYLSHGVEREPTEGAEPTNLLQVATLLDAQDEANIAQVAAMARPVNEAEAGLGVTRKVAVVFVRNQKDFDRILRFNVRYENIIRQAIADKRMAIVTMEEAELAAGASRDHDGQWTIDVAKLPFFVPNEFKALKGSEKYRAQILSSQPTMFDLSHVDAAVREWQIQFLVRVLDGVFVTVEAAHLSGHIEFMHKLQALIDSQA